MKHTFFFILTILLASQIQAQTKQLHFRTDGYYYYDNKCDTIFLTQMAQDRRLEFVAKLSEAGITVGNLECIPTGQMVIMGGSLIDIFSFFTENGTCDDYGGSCWNPTVYTKTLLEMKDDQNAYSSGAIDKKKLKHLILHKDNTFENYNSMERISGTLYEDRIVLTRSFPEYMGFKFWRESRTYRFYKFDQCPPTRDKFVYVYKDPFKQ